MAIRIVVVDDHHVFRHGLRHVLEAEPDMDVVGEARTGDEAIRLAQIHRPHVMLLDARLEDMEGPEVCSRVRSVAPKTAVVMLSAYLPDGLILRSLTAGAKGYLVKDVEVDELKKTIRAVYRGNAVLDPRVAPHIIAAVAAGQMGKRAGSRAPSSALSETNMTIIRHLSRGLSNKEIAPLVHLSPHTVKDRVEQIRVALDARSRADIVGEAFRKGLLLPY